MKTLLTNEISHHKHFHNFQLSSNFPQLKLYTREKKRRNSVDTPYSWCYTDSLQTKRNYHLYKFSHLQSLPSLADKTETSFHSNLLNERWNAAECTLHTPMRWWYHPIPYLVLCFIFSFYFFPSIYISCSPSPTIYSISPSLPHKPFIASLQLPRYSLPASIIPSTGNEKS